MRWTVEIARPRFVLILYVLSQPIVTINGDCPNNFFLPLLNARLLKNSMHQQRVDYWQHFFQQSTKIDQSERAEINCTPLGDIAPTCLKLGDNRRFHRFSCQLPDKQNLREYLGSPLKLLRFLRDGFVGPRMIKRSTGFCNYGQKSRNHTRVNDFFSGQWSFRRIFILGKHFV